MKNALSIVLAAVLVALLVWMIYRSRTENVLYK